MRTFIKKMGIILIIASFILYGSILLIPFTPFTSGTKVVLGTALAVAGEVSFWVGGIILGKEVVQKYKKYLNPLNWFGGKRR